jgi:hypothetical protein
MPEASISMLNLERRFHDGDLQPSETLHVGGRAVLKCRARKVEITLLNAVGEGRNASVQREFRGGECRDKPD